MIFILCCACYSFAEDELLDDTPATDQDRTQTVAIQNRPYIMNKELGMFYAYMPLDHFHHFHAFGANYLHYFNDYFGWEVVNGAFVNKQSTNLDSRLVNDYGVIPETVDILKYYYTTNLVYTPLYMKHLYNNKDIRFGDLSFVLGGGQSRFDVAGNTGLIQLGFIARFIGQEGLNFKLDVRYLTFLKDNVRPNMTIGFVMTYNFSDKPKGDVQLDEE